MSETVLVTGGAGFIGSHTVDHLLERGYQVRILDQLQPRVHPKGKPDYLPREAEFRVGDVASKEDLAAALDGVTYVIHLAAYQDYLPDFSTFLHVNAESAALLFELVVERHLSIKRIVFASSQSVAGEGKYECIAHGVMMPAQRTIEQLENADWDLRCPTCGEVMKPLLIDERTCRPHTAYAISKYAVELLANSLGTRYGIPTACMRYTYVQGSRNSLFNAYSGVARIFAMRIRQGLAPVCYEDGMQLRDYVNVADVARANVFAMESSTDHAVYNVGGGRGISVLEFARVMLSVFSSSLEPTVPGLFRVGDTRHTVSDITPISALGWKPTVPVQQSALEYLEWLSHFSITRAYLDEADRVMREQGVVRGSQRALAT